MAENTMQNGEEHKKGFDIGGLFGKKHEIQGPNVSEAIMKVNEVARRVRLLESRYTDLNRKVEVNEKNMLTDRKRIAGELKTNDLDTLEIKKEINELKSNVDMMISELKNLASREDLEAVKKYVELWEPVNFITRDEVENIIKEMIEDNKR